MRRLILTRDPFTNLVDGYFFQKICVLVRRYFHNKIKHLSDLFFSAHILKILYKTNLKIKYF